MFYLCGTACAAANKVREGKGVIVVGGKCTGALGGLAMFSIIAVLCAAMDFLFGLLRENHYYHSS